MEHVEYELAVRRLAAKVFDVDITQIESAHIYEESSIDSGGCPTCQPPYTEVTHEVWATLEDGERKFYEYLSFEELLKDLLEVGKG